MLFAYQSYDDLEEGVWQFGTDPTAVHPMAVEDDDDYSFLETDIPIAFPGATEEELVASCEWASWHLMDKVTGFADTAENLQAEYDVHFWDVAELNARVHNPGVFTDYTSAVAWLETLTESEESHG